MSRTAFVLQDTPHLGGSGVVISEVISKVTINITHIRGFMATLKTTHEPSSKLRYAEVSRTWHLLRGTRTES